MANIKYKDNGEYKDIVVKVGDTQPIGTIVDYDGTEVPNGWEEVDDPNTYSTDETRIGTWVDGKPIYRKVINVNGSQFNNQITFIAHNISNISEVVNQRFIYKRTTNNGQLRQFPSIYYGNGNWDGQIYVTPDSIAFELGTAVYEAIQQYSINGRVVLEYTKTTD